MYLQRNTEERLRNSCCRGKAISVTYSECVSVALLIQHAKSILHIILSSVADMTVKYAITLYHKQHDFRNKKLLNIKLIFSTTFVRKISHSKKKCV
jgi:hypothetical protein